MTNMSMTRHILEWLKDQGVTDLCLCPGGRNSPFVEHLTQFPTDFQVHTSFDERASGFFAMGLSQKQNRPVAIITTSGTAVAEVLPSLMEAYYSGIPLVVITADRPKKLRGTGAPQAVEQKNIFGIYVESCFDLENEFIRPKWSVEKPLHINVCFDEPLLDARAEALQSLVKENKKTLFLKSGASGKVETLEQLTQSFKDFLNNKKSPLLLVSTLAPHEVSFVKTFMEKWPGPIYTESPSGLREINLQRQLISGDRILMQIFKDKKIDAVVRIGGIPTARLWRTLEGNDFPVFSLSSKPFAGLSRGEFFHLSLDHLDQLHDVLESHNSLETMDLYARDQQKHKEWQKLLSKYPQSEPALMAWISRQIPSKANVYIGNSLPIREWDLLAQRENPFHVIANRGANGIDGQLSTALAYLSPDKPLWVILGDLTTLYDSNALWFWRSYPHNLKLVVMNNQGGQIFNRMFTSPLFCNSHTLNFSSWAEQWSLDYLKVTQPTNVPDTSYLLELSPEPVQTQNFWKEYDLLWEKN